MPSIILKTSFRRKKAKRSTLPLERTVLSSLALVFMNLEHGIFFISVWLLGAIFGSFTSVVLWRLKTGESGIATGRSRCPQCKTTLGALDLVPLLSYCFLGGKCRFCRKRISVIYPLLETSFAILLLLFVLRFVPIDLILKGDPFSIITFLFWGLMTFVIIAFIFYDILFMEVPLEILIPATIILIGLLFGLAWNIVPNMFPHFLRFADPNILNIPLINATLWATTIFFFFYGQYALSWWKWIGGGDIYIGIFMGLLAGFKLSILGLFLGYIIGSVVGVGLMMFRQKKMNARIPFGPALGVGLCVALLWGAPILEWYTSLIH